jgi:hypothetical protein
LCSRESRDVQGDRKPHFCRHWDRHKPRLGTRLTSLAPTRDSLVSFVEAIDALASRAPATAGGESKREAEPRADTIREIVRYCEIHKHSVNGRARILASRPERRSSAKALLRQLLRPANRLSRSVLGPPRRPRPRLACPKPNLCAGPRHQHHHSARLYCEAVSP